jgi:hypothetical protein
MSKPSCIVNAVSVIWLTATGSVVAQPTVKVEVDAIFGRHGIEAIGYAVPEFQPTLVRLVGNEATNLKS